MPEVLDPLAYVTMVLTDSYVIGAMVMGHSLRRFTDKRMICMVTSNLNQDSLETLSTLWELKTVNKLDSKDKTRLSLLGRPELGPTLTKVQVWSLHEHGVQKAIFLDADMLVIQPIDDLFSRPEFAACPDAGWPDCFNSGLFVCEPREETHRALLLYAHQHGSFDGGDQGLLNSFFSNWSRLGPEHRIPFTYNLTSNATYSYLPAMIHYRDQIKVVHFIGPVKPWMSHRPFVSKVDHHDQHDAILSFIQAWWDIHDKYLSIGTPTTPFTQQQSQHLHVPPTDAFDHQQNHVNRLSSDFAKFDFANYRIKWCDEIQTIFHQTTPTNSSPQQSLTKDKIKHPVPHRLLRVSDELGSLQDGQYRKLRSPTELDDPCDARYYDDQSGEEGATGC